MVEPERVKWLAQSKDLPEREVLFARRACLAYNR
jgi:hypothetical protein